MTASLASPSLVALLATGFLLGWSVAWPPGPINAEIARRCGSGNFWWIAAPVGASSADALWAVAVALGVGLLFAAPLGRAGMGVVSIALLLALAALFLRGRAAGLRASFGRAELPARGARALRLRPRGCFGLGSGHGAHEPVERRLLARRHGPAGACGGAGGIAPYHGGGGYRRSVTWGILWASAECAPPPSLEGAAKRWWTIFVDLATGALMLYFAVFSAQRLMSDFRIYVPGVVRFRIRKVA